MSRWAFVWNPGEDLSHYYQCFELCVRPQFGSSDPAAIRRIINGEYKHKPLGGLANFGPLSFALSCGFRTLAECMLVLFQNGAKR